EQARLKHEDTRLSLSTDIQGFWINATANSRRYVSAQASVESAQDSYNLLSEQFRLGLKNIVELTNAKTALLNAQQNRLESKYTALLYLRLLDLYGGH
ncbi:MAG: TolC family protein, partial [Prevotella sp.]